MVRQHPTRAEARRSIRGPHSALTDFLQSHNISARQIVADADSRRAAASASRVASAATGGGDNDDNKSDTSDESDAESMPAPLRRTKSIKDKKKRKAEQQKALAKIKASRKFQRQREFRKLQCENNPDEELTDDSEAALAVYEESYVVHEQVDNCEVCGTRFNVTGYAKSGSKGGLLCPKCTKELEDEEKSRKRKRPANRDQRRLKQSQYLDGDYKTGAKSLTSLCVEVLASNVDLAEDLGDLPPKVVDKLAAKLAKYRLLTPSSLNLFLSAKSDTVTIYEGAKLGSDDFIRVFQLVPGIKNFRARNSVQFKNKVMSYLTNSTVELESLSIHGANLIDDQHWDDFLVQKGKFLRALKVYYTDGHFGDEQIDMLKETCPNLKRLKVSHNQKMTDEGIKYVASLSGLEHLTLQLYKTTSTDAYVEVIETIGSDLNTFALNTINYVDDSLLESLHKHCKKLKKLRLTDNETFTDEAFAKLFTDWSNPALTNVDFNKCRLLEATNPQENEDGIGFSSKGLTALMRHSGPQLTHLKIHSCRHITRETLEELFSGANVYPELKWMDVSFIPAVSDFIVGCIFRSCPKLQILKVFGNFGVTQEVEPYVPSGRILNGVPTALGLELRGRG